MRIRLSINDKNIHKKWDHYVRTHKHSTVYHLLFWKEVVTSTYGHKAYYITATNEQLQENKLVGILPLVHLKHFMFGNKLISLPFFDTAGVLADNKEIGKQLIQEGVKLGRSLGVSQIELRQSFSLEDIPPNLQSKVSIAKVRMMMELPEEASSLMTSFKSKLRSQIKKPIKEGLYEVIGGKELLEDFYTLFTINMRDLGSPVHSIDLFANLLKHNPYNTKIILIKQVNTTVAGAIVVGFQDILFNPWASSLRQFRKLSPNMLLYWTMLEYAITHNYSFFDFGRSTPKEGCYKFKEQWGATPKSLYWHSINLGQESISESLEQKDRFQKAITCWQKLPLPVSRILGPMIRKHISL